MTTVWKAIYEKKGSRRGEGPRVERIVGAGDPDPVEWAKKAADDEKFIGVFPDNNANNGLTDGDGKIVQFGPDNAPPLRRR